MHLNVLHTQVFIYTCYVFSEVVQYPPSQHWLSVLNHAWAATVSHDPGCLMLPYLWILFGLSVALGHMFTPGHLSPTASQLCFLNHLRLRVIENVFMCSMILSEGCGFVCCSVTELSLWYADGQTSNCFDFIPVSKNVFLLYKLLWILCQILLCLLLWLILITKSKHMQSEQFSVLSLPYRCIYVPCALWPTIYLP